MKRIISTLAIAFFILLTFASSKTMDECSSCDGKGIQKCWVCGGDGLIDEGGDLDNAICHSCQNGFAKCTICRGTGKYPY